MKKDKNIRKINSFLAMQLFLIISMFLVALFFSGNQLAISMLTGGLVAFIPAFIFAKKLFSVQGASAAKQIVRNFYLGEALKIGLTLLLFTTVFIFCNVRPLAFFLTYIIVVMTHWLAPLIVNNQQKRPKSD